MPPDSLSRALVLTQGHSDAGPTRNPQNVLEKYSGGCRLREAVSLLRTLGSETCASAVCCLQSLFAECGPSPEPVASLVFQDAASRFQANASGAFIGRGVRLCWAWHGVDSLAAGVNHRAFGSLQANVFVTFRNLPAHSCSKDC